MALAKMFRLFQTRYNSINSTDPDTIQSVVKLINDGINFTKKHGDVIFCGAITIAMTVMFGKFFYDISQCDPKIYQCLRTMTV